MGNQVMPTVSREIVVSNKLGLHARPAMQFVDAANQFKSKVTVFKGGDEPCEADVVVGLHSDGATQLCIDYAAKHRIAFAVVPCCSENGTSYNPWRKHLLAHARSLQFADVGEHTLDMRGRAAVIWGT